MMALYIVALVIVTIATVFDFALWRGTRGMESEDELIGNVSGLHLIPLIIAIVALGFAIAARS